MMEQFQKKIEIQGNQFYIGHWDSKNDALMQGIHKKLELPNWAPWLAADLSSLQGRAQTFKEGQIVMFDNMGNPAASLSMNRITWDGLADSLPNWDTVAGDPTTYEKTYDPKGNTLVMMSMNVSEQYQKMGLARNIIQYAQEVGQNLSIQNLIGSFRPNKYGHYRADWDMYDLDFETYCHLQQRETGLPLDDWLRSLVRNGMEYIKVDHTAMTVPLAIDQLEAYMKKYKKDQWKWIDEYTLECGEVGKFHLNHPGYPGQAVYIESNMWGIVRSK